MPNFFNPNFHNFAVHLALFLDSNYNGMFVLDLWHGLLLENDQQLQFGAISCVCQNDSHAVLFISKFIVLSCMHANECSGVNDRQTKGSEYNAQCKFQTVNFGKKCALYTGKYCICIRFKYSDGTIYHLF